MPILSTIWDIIWWFFSIFVFVAYLKALFSIITDLFRDREISGAAKAIWMLFLVFLPFITAVAYLVARGKGMGERAAKQVQAQQTAAETYIREVAGTATPTDEIARAKALLDAGAITPDEFTTLKQAALRR